MSTVQYRHESPLATVNICTRNRSRSLKRTLDSILVASKCVGDPWEIHVIDNGSTDETSSVIEQYVDVLPIRRINAPVPGLSNARNVGIDNANGKFIIWTDDDVCVSEGWLKAYLDCFKSADGYDFFGGKATPRYEEPSVDWFVRSERYIMPLLAIRDEPSWTEIVEDELPWGLNYAVRCTVQKQHRYDPELGVAPGRRRGGEETAMLKSAISGGAIGKWVWEAEVMHMIPVERQTAKYIWQYYRAAGEDWPVAPFTAHTSLVYSARVAKIGISSAVKAGVLWLMRDLRWVRHYALLAQSYGSMQVFKVASWSAFRNSS